MDAAWLKRELIRVKNEINFNNEEMAHGGPDRTSIVAALKAEQAEINERLCSLKLTS